MKFKRFFLALPIAALTILFAFCAKEPQTTSETAQPQTTVERGPCTVSIQAVNCSVDLCGVQTNSKSCTTPGQFGEDFLSTSSTGTFNMITPATVTATLNTFDPADEFSVPYVIVTTTAGTMQYVLDPKNPEIPAVLNVGITCQLL